LIADAAPNAHHPEIEAVEKSGLSICTLGAPSDGFSCLDELLEGLEADHFGGGNVFDELVKFVCASKSTGDMCAGVDSGPGADE
jgi:hypothetical protein